MSLNSPFFEKKNTFVFKNKPLKGLATFPTKGSMAFWYNLKPNGRKAEQSLHGACPTLYGVKWGKSSSKVDF